MPFPPFVPAWGVWTVADLERLPADGNRYEILHGELLWTRPPPSIGHVCVAAGLYTALAAWCIEQPAFRDLWQGEGVYISETTWLNPDIALYQTPGDRIPDLRDSPPPVLVVEVLSKSTTKRDRHRKRAAYLAHGVGEVWTISPKYRTVERWTSASEFPELFGDFLLWTPDGMKPEFVMIADELFGPEWADDG
ncbi:MAG: Uma2 family endonuclease [Phycisphaerae bacterium]|nr:Uma2 family endonuclease [Gemmatimonadaceae bacterium]